MSKPEAVNPLRRLKKAAMKNLGITSKKKFNKLLKAEKRRERVRHYLP